MYCDVVNFWWFKLSFPQFVIYGEKFYYETSFSENVESQNVVGCAWQVSVPKGSLCNLTVNVNVGLPPDAVYNIVIDPDNKRVFKNIKVSYAIPFTFIFY